MENLDIQPTGSTPLVRFNADTGKFMLKGRSIPENPGEFFERIMGWLKEYFSETDKDTELEFMLEYANSGSSKWILEILKDLQEYASEGNQIKIIWSYEIDDESIEELGELFQNSVDLPFEMKGVEEDEDEGLS